jgi:flagellar basal-body rod protein FlgB
MWHVACYVSAEAPKRIGQAIFLTVQRVQTATERYMSANPVGSVANLDNYLGVHTAGLKVSAQRMELLAKNLANADTPNFKSRDIDFRSALAQAGSRDAPIRMTATQPGHIAAAGATAGASPDQKYRVPLAPSLDGNTVDVQLEQAAFADNAVRYQASLTFLGAKFRALMTAITGQ